MLKLEGKGKNLCNYANENGGPGEMKIVSRSEIVV